MPGNTSIMPVLFHGFIAVAPLKRRGPQLRRAVLRLFHGFIAVAPLKHLESRITSHIPRLFHGFIAVAPLKRLRGPLRVSRPTALPRLHRRGPIEASPTVAGTLTVTASSTASSPWPH